MIDNRRTITRCPTKWAAIYRVRSQQKRTLNSLKRAMDAINKSIAGAYSK